MSQINGAFGKPMYEADPTNARYNSLQLQCYEQRKEINRLNEHITELENRLRALWNKLEGERKFYDQRIRELEIAGNAMYAFINPPSPSMRTIRMDNLLQGWDDAKIGKGVKP
jgi:hypothetical protein